MSDMKKQESPTWPLGDLAHGRVPMPAIVSRMNEIKPTSDPIYKRLYSFPEMVADLLHSLLPGKVVEGMDMGSLEKMSAEYVGDDFRKRHGDTVWRVRADGAEGGWAYALVLVEFQSSTDPTMALRVLEYTAMLYRDLLRAKVVKPGELPPVLLLYNGESPWSAALDVRDLIVETGPTLAAYQPSQRCLLLDERHVEADDMGELTSAVVRLEQSSTAEDLFAVEQMLAKRLVGPEHRELRRAFADWLWVLERQLRSPDEPATQPPPDLTLEEVGMRLEERVARWRDPWIEQGKQQGIEQGKREHGREQLRRQAEVRFGAATAERLSALLQAEDDLQRLDALAVAVVRCETADDLLRQASNGATHA